MGRTTDTAIALAARRLQDAARDFASIDARVRGKSAGFVILTREDAEAIKALLHRVKNGRSVQLWSSKEVEFTVPDALARSLHAVRLLPLDEEVQGG